MHPALQFGRPVAAQAPPGKTLDQMWRELDDGCALFSDLWNCDIPLIAVENPVMHRHARDGFALPATQSKRTALAVR